MTLLWVAPVSAKIYSIHFASYKTAGQAEIELNGLRSRGYAAFVREADVAGSGKWYRVYAGQYETRRQAAEAASAMKRKQEIDQIFIHSFDEKKPQTVLEKVRQTESASAVSPPSKIVIIGNKTSKRYHLPGMPFYSKVKKHHRIIFSSEQEAVNQGYYKAGTGAAGAYPIRQQKQEDDVKGTVGKLLTEKQGQKLTEDDVTARKKKEAFVKLMKGNEKIMPAPVILADIDKTTEDVFKEPDEREISEPNSDSALYNKALDELKEKKYEQALVTFKEFISREDTGKEWGQRALRHMADCHYYLGKQGRKENLLIAAEFYKNTLESFPDPRKENALTYYRLARTYEHLKYYPEAIKQYQNLTAKYPDSAYGPEAYYKIGDIYYQDGKYSQAAESLIRYLMKYRGKVNGKKSFYLIAHAFYKGKQSTNAEIWFRDARKKWPDLTDMPKDLILDYGLHKVSLRRYDEAVEAFSFYVNLYPNDEKIKNVLMLLAKAYEDANQQAPALAVYSHMIDKYPNTKEADESMLAMATLGVEKPGIKVFRFLRHIQFYRDPMGTYDTLIMKNATGDVGEEAMLQKAAALVRKGQGRKAADVYLEFLKLHPESKRVADAARGLKTASAALIDEYYAKKDYLAVAYVYFKSFGAVSLQADEYPQVNKIALSLKELGFIDDYVSILNRYLKVAADETIINKVSLDIAEGLIIRGKYDNAQMILATLAARPSVKKSLPLAAGIQKNLAEIAYRRQAYDQAVNNYDAVVRSGQEISDPGRIYANYARSLEAQKQNDRALQNYLTAVKYLSEQKHEKVNAGIAYKEIGDLYLSRDNLAGGLDMYGKSLASATDEELKFWSQFLVGKTYLRMNKNDQAQNIFAQMKAAAGAEGFWTKVVDFYEADAKWWNKYGDSVKK
ncbi:MAG: tetratricopeptide repeat protein [Deltaproteobacteria bacterium]